MSIRKRYNRYRVTVTRVVEHQKETLSGSTDTYEQATAMEARFIEELESRRPAPPGMISPAALQAWGHA